MMCDLLALTYCCTASTMEKYFMSQLVLGPVRGQTTGARVLDSLFWGLCDSNHNQVTCASKR